MTEKIDWKQELLDSEKFNKKQENLLKNGAKSLTDSWLLVTWRSLHQMEKVKRHSRTIFSKLQFKFSGMD